MPDKNLRYIQRFQQSHSFKLIKLSAQQTGVLDSQAKFRRPQPRIDNDQETSDIA